MLALASATGEEWLARALAHRDELLLEQAHLERKAASAALTFMFTYQDLPQIQQPLAELAREELTHYELVLAELSRRGLPFARQVPCGYAARLHQAISPREPERGRDAMLVCALIEARSCERLKLLADGWAARDAALSALYRTLTVSEARHHALYVELARASYPALGVDRRLQELARCEAQALLAGPRQARLHG
jgi:tRNA-(ms[2]io[6]A)-hydroxylase